MKLKVFSVFDVKAAVYAHPFVMPNEAMALRGFKDAVNRPDGELGKHPEDYSLCLLGEFDDSVGRLSPLNQPDVLATAAAMKEPDRQMVLPMKEVAQEGKEEVK